MATFAKRGPRVLLIFVFEDVELLDFCGPFEVFTAANKVVGGGLFTVFTVAESADPVITRNGLSVNPAFTFGSAPEHSLVLIPGGRGTRKVMGNEAALAWIRSSASEAELVLSVCTGSLLLAKAGMLDGLRAATHHDAIEELRGKTAYLPLPLPLPDFALSCASALSFFMYASASLVFLWT